jgi:nucleotide-binding universal stress UspA family protein
MKILHPTDFSECAQQAQEEAARLARALGGEVVLFHVSVEAPLYAEGLIGVKDVEKVYEAQRKWAEETLEARAAALREKGVASRWLLRVGIPFEEIAEAAREERADLIVMGTHGRGGLARFFLGSVADRVLRTAPCPVLTVRERRSAGD